MALSNITLTAGMRANLLSLQNTQNLFEVTQTRLATGKKVNTALDDPIAYFAAKGYSDRASDLAALKDGMNEAIQIVKAADAGITAIEDLIAQAKSLATSALSTASTTERSSLAAQFDSLRGQITDLAEDANYKGTNLLDNDDLVVKFNESKKILEWSNTPEEGFRAALSLNNKYELDGRDPNGFTGVAWCFGKHDRPWGEREIFGNVRYMNAGGLKREFVADEYVRQVDRLRPKLT